MTHEYKKFSEVFNKYRLKAQFETLAQFGEALAREGFLYEDSMFSRWKNGHREPKRRKLILAIIRVFIKYKSITSSNQANDLLDGLDQHHLLEQEQIELFNPPSTFTYEKREFRYWLNDEDALFIAQKVLGAPYVTLYKEKVQQIYRLTKSEPHTFIKLLQEIESKPDNLENILRKAQNSKITKPLYVADLFFLNNHSNLSFSAKTPTKVSRFFYK